MTAEEVVSVLSLSPHPEGGHYRQTWEDASSTAIYFLLARDEESRWHRVRDRAEVWHYYGGSPLLLWVNDGEPLAAGGPAVLGLDLAGGQRPQAVVPAGAWQRARSTGAWTLVGCTVSPPFTFDAFDLGGSEQQR